MMDFTDNTPLCTMTPIFSSAIQITRPNTNSRPGSSKNSSPANQTKVAKLVLKPPRLLQDKYYRKPQEKLKNQQNTQNNLRPKEDSKIKLQEADRYKVLTKKYQPTDYKVRKVDIEKKALNLLNASKEESVNHKTPAMDEAARKTAREFIKKQREKRKLETKKEVDKSFVIKQRLNELRKTTKNVINNKPKKSLTPMKISPPRDFHSINDFKQKEIKVLKLKPLSGKNQKSPVTKPHVEDPVTVVEESFEISPAKRQTESPKQNMSPTKKSKSPLLLQNQIPTRFETSHKPVRPASFKENKKPLDDMKLKVPDVKLSMSTIHKTELASAPYQADRHPVQSRIPSWLQNTGVQPYPYNFIWAVRKKLEAYTSAQQSNIVAKPKEPSRLETPLMKLNRGKKGRKLPNFSKIPSESSPNDLQRPTLTDDSETNLTSIEQELAYEGNTISEISSIQSDLVKSKSQENDQKQKHDDTNITESLPKEDTNVGNGFEIFTTDFSQGFSRKVTDLGPENVSPNTSEKRRQFLSSTLNVPAKKPVNHEQNDLSNSKLNQEKEQEYQNMLEVFTKGLSNVIEVNDRLVAVLSNKNSVTSSQASGKLKNYSSSFENNVETELKTSADFSEMNRVQQSPPPGQSISNSSIKTLLEDTPTTSFKPNGGDLMIEDPPIVYNEAAPELSSSSTKLTATTTTKIVQRKISIEKKEELETTFNQSNLLGMFRYSESEKSFNIADNNESFGLLMEKSSTEIRSWERNLIERTRGQIAWLELQKQSFRKVGQQDRASAIKKQQRAILLRLEKERLKLKNNSEMSMKRTENHHETLDKSAQLTGNDSEARENIEIMLQKREEKLKQRRTQVEQLISWQRKLDKEEEKLKLMEKDLLSNNKKKLSSSPKKKFDGDLLNTSMEMVKSIDKSLKVLESIKPSSEQETVEVSGEKLNKLWLRLTGVHEKLYEPKEIYHLSKRHLAQFYEEAKEVVLQNDLKNLLDNSMVPALPIKAPSKEKAEDYSDVSTLCSIANIETEEEYCGSFPLEAETATTTENFDELQQLSQMKVFLDRKKPLQGNEFESAMQLTPTVDNATFVIRPKSVNGLDKSSSTIGESDMDIEQTEALSTIDILSIGHEGFIIPEIIIANDASDAINKITDMDQDDNLLIEDISFPNLEISMSNETLQVEGNDNRNDLSTITECTEYEQSQGSSCDGISSEIVSYASTGTTSERVSSEIEKRLITINDSLEEVNEAFKNVAIVNRSPSTVTYSTDKDFVESKSNSTEQTQENQPTLLEISASDSSSITASTPKPQSDTLSQESGDF